MHATFLFLHVLGATILGFYLLLPFVSGNLVNSGASPQAGAIGILGRLNRIGQFGLILEFLTGGYLVSKAYDGGQVSVLWIILSVVLLVALGAFTGILGVTLKKLAAGNNGAQQAAKAKKLTIAAGFVFLLLIIIMKNQQWFV